MFGCWLIVVCCLIVKRCLLVYCLPFVDCWLVSVVSCVMFAVVGCWLLVVCCLLRVRWRACSVVCISLCDVCCAFVV